jgi:hypothetical protein
MGKMHQYKQYAIFRRYLGTPGQGPNWPGGTGVRTPEHGIKHRSIDRSLTAIAGWL